MATRYLGREIDIHTGGVDHIAVHHTNEIAQSENALGVNPWVRFWMHGAWLNFDGEKISKSRAHERKAPDLDDLGAFGVTPADFRYYLYTAHYRSPLALSKEALRGAEAARRRLGALARAAVPLVPDTLPSSEALRRLRRKFFDALYDDLNVPRALAAIWEIVELSEPLAERAEVVRELSDVIGLDLSESAPEREDDAEIDALVAERERARKELNFALSDALRVELAARGVVVEDRSDGTRWRRAR
jgi:cysteinyl-tRNA synthetase